MTRNKELWYALFAIFFITVVYGVVVYFSRQIPSASSFFGHALGILGFMLMLMTETLYSLRKRARTARWGPMASWLQFHIFTGLVGPYMVLLHTSWRFYGLAGVTALLTLIVVLSGFIGRYIYTQVPRTLDGSIVEAAVSPDAARRARQWLSWWHMVHIPLGMALFTAAFIHILAALYYATFLK